MNPHLLAFTWRIYDATGVDLSRATPWLPPVDPRDPRFTGRPPGRPVATSLGLLAARREGVTFTQARREAESVATRVLPPGTPTIIEVGSMIVSVVSVSRRAFVVPS